MRRATGHVRTIVRAVSDEILALGLDTHFPMRRGNAVRVEPFRPDAPRTAVLYILHPIGEVLREVYRAPGGAAVLAGDAARGFGLRKSWAQLASALSDRDYAAARRRPAYRLDLDPETRADAVRRHAASRAIASEWQGQP